MAQCIDCIHYKTCKDWDFHNYIKEGHIECINCSTFLNKKSVMVKLSWDTYEDILEAIRKARIHTNAIRKSKNRDSALFELDRIEYLIRGVGDTEVN